MEEKMKRSSNFTGKEENLLVSLVQQKYAKIIENKRTDSNSNKIKGEAWANLKDEFNSLSGEAYRDVNALKTKYNNLKKRSKRNFATSKQYMYGTGGGPPKIVNDTPLDTSIHEIIGTQMTGLPSEFDGDAEPTINKENIPPTIENQEEPAEDVIIEWPSNRNSRDEPLVLMVHNDLTDVVNDYDNITLNPEQLPSISSSLVVTEGAIDWSSYTPSQLRTPVAPSLKRKREDGNLRTKLSQWAAAKKNVAAITEKCLLEEHTLKIKILQEAHLAQMKQNEEKHELAMKHSITIHELQKKKIALETDILMFTKEKCIIENKKL